MRKLQYKLADGTIVNTFAQAENSGQRYTNILTEIHEPYPKMSEKRRQALIERFGLKV